MMAMTWYGQHVSVSSVVLSFSTKSNEFVHFCDVDICLTCISLLALLVLSLAAFPEDGHDTCDASSRQRSH